MYRDMEGRDIQINIIIKKVGDCEKTSTLSLKGGGKTQRACIYVIIKHINIFFLTKKCTKSGFFQE